MFTNDEELKKALDKSPAARVTQEYIESRIKQKEFHRIGNAGVLCVLTLDNGFTVTGFSAAANPENFNMDIGKTYSYKYAFQSLWPLFGFLLCEGGFNRANENKFGDVNATLRTVVNNARRLTDVGHVDEGSWTVPHEFMQKAFDVYTNNDDGDDDHGGIDAQESAAA